MEDCDVQPEDNVLLERIAGGDKSALTFLYDRYAAVLFSAASRFFVEKGDAEDLTHDVFLEIWKKAGTFDPDRGSARTWILMRLRSRALDRRKSAYSTRVVPVGDDVQTLAGVPDETASAERLLDQGKVRVALQSLPEVQRAVLELAYFRGWSSAEIAAQLSIPVGTVKSRVAAGMKNLRRIFVEREGET